MQTHQWCIFAVCIFLSGVGEKTEPPFVRWRPHGWPAGRPWFWQQQQQLQENWTGFMAQQWRVGAAFALEDRGCERPSYARPTITAVNLTRLATKSMTVWSDRDPGNVSGDQTSLFAWTCALFDLKYVECWNFKVTEDFIPMEPQTHLHWIFILSLCRWQSSHVHLLYPAEGFPFSGHLRINRWIFKKKVVRLIVEKK